MSNNASPGIQKDLTLRLLPSLSAMQSASGGNHGSRSWGDPQDRAASPRPRCIAFNPFQASEVAVTL
ncbi:hypothetical protein [Moorena producens]|uniref:hypothetical protein n=1 Tax=Moorena producens TaxID=1155739 RepID=UPI0011EA6995|nr:hypothetical protein [Moorena producens]